MGLIGLLITIGIMMLGAGYYYFGAGAHTITATNKNPIPTLSSEVSRYQDLKGQANAVKDLVENQAKQTVREGEDPTVAVSVKEPAPSKETAPADKGTLKIIDRLVDFGFSVADKRSIDTIVLHSSYAATGNDPYGVSAVIKQWQGYKVAPHYMIDRGGTVYRLVEDKNIAYHAGVSKMPDGRSDVNDFSIGIEIINQEKTQMTKAEYTAVNDLVNFLKEKYPIKFVVGHNDIAPGRKTDPWNFDWKKLKE